jgi:uncharacterized protein YqhQ
MNYVDKTAVIERKILFSVEEGIAFEIVKTMIKTFRENIDKIGRYSDYPCLKVTDIQDESKCWYFDDDSLSDLLESLEQLSSNVFVEIVDES